MNKYGLNLGGNNESRLVMFGAFYGDVIGSEYENACTKDYDFSFKRESHFTDDSVMTAAVCKFMSRIIIFEMLILKKCNADL